MLREPGAPTTEIVTQPAVPDLATGQPPPNQFVGRGDELEKLRFALDAARCGRGSFFSISGEPGIGKTHLAAKLSDEAAGRGMRVLWGRCWESGGAPSYWPWIEVIRQAMKDGASPPAHDLGRHADYLAELVPELAPRLGTKIGNAAPPADPESARFFVFDAVAMLLRSLAGREPVLVVIDDFHAADRVSLLLLTFLARTLSDSPVVLVGTYRDRDAARSPDLVEPLAELARFATRLALRGLSEAEVGVLIEGRTGRRPGGRLVARVHDVTEGNPFFVGEIIRLVATPTRLDLDDGVLAFPIPDGVRETVRRRLAPLDEASRSLLALAAVVGREFESTTLRTASGMDLVAVLQALEKPIAHGLVLEVPGSTGRFCFCHALIREVVYEDLPPARRLMLHRRVGEALEALSAGDPERYSAELAHHFLVAAPGAHDDRFVGHAVRAARQAMSRMAFEEAVDLFQRTISALVHASPDERRRAELLLGLCAAKEWANDVPGSRIAAEQAAEIARRLGASDLLARAALAVGAIAALKSTAASRCETAEPLLVEALRVVSPHDASTRARLRSRLALHHLSLGTRGDALIESARAISDARSAGDAETLVHALICRHAVLYGPDGIDERCAIAQEILALARKLGSREFTMRAHALRVVNDFDRGDMRAVDEATELHRQLAEESADPFERWANIIWRSARALVAGRFDDATALSRQAFELTKSVPGLHAVDINGPTSYVGQTMVIQEARFDGVPDPEVIARHRARYPEVVVWQVAHLHRLTRLGLVDEVRREIDSFGERRFAELEKNGTWLAAMSFLSEAVALIGDRDRAAELYSLLLPYADRNVTISFVTCRGSVSRFLGLLAATLDDLEGASRHFEAALAKHRQMGAVAYVAVTLHDQATALARRANPADVARAIELSREAHRIASDLGMKGLVDRCATFLSDHHEPPNGAGVGTARGEFSLIRDGQIWTLSRDDDHVLLKDSKGLRYLAELVRQPDRQVHVLELVALFADDPCLTKGRLGRDVATGGRSEFADKLVDPRALRAYRARLEILVEELGRAQAADPEETLVLRQEVQSLRREIARATSLGGRVRRESATERARISVTRTIRLALSRMVEASPGIGAAFAGRIHTGAYCSYASLERSSSTYSRSLAPSARPR